MAKNYSNFINGKWTRSQSRVTFDNINPANTAEVVGRFPESDEEDIEKAEWVNIETFLNSGKKIYGNIKDVLKLAKQT